MSMSIAKTIEVTFGEVIIGKFELNEEQEIQASIELATGENGMIIIYFCNDRKWHYLAEIGEELEEGSFNAGSYEAFEEKFTSLVMDSDLLHKTTIPMPVLQTA